MKHTLFITGGAGYVGAMLCDQFSKRDDMEKIVALDVEEKPEFLAQNEKVEWIRANTVDTTWQDIARGANPDIVIHTAWHIREMYGKKKEQWRWNVLGSKNVFEFVFGTSSVKKIIHFSTAAIYGACAGNTIEYRFTEKDPMREEEYSYAREKKRAEELLRKAWEEGAHNKNVFIIRPAAITGPRGRFMRIRFGLQSALMGQLKGSVAYRIVSLLVSFVPATPLWVRQFIHEDDVCDIVAHLAFEKEPQGGYDVLNITPPGAPVLAQEMARAVGKKVLMIWPWMVFLAHFFFWHVTQGKIPTGRGVWRFYSYPVVMDGTKITNQYGYVYAHSSGDAFRHTAGRYEQYIPREVRSPK